MLPLELTMVLQKKSDVEVGRVLAYMKLPPVVRVFPSLVKYDFSCLFSASWRSGEREAH